ncbi:MAG: dihydropteroate synthase [Bacteroides sp.]|nr:dihydropteroate synthase [Bacillota bacterium]MCM1394088.1 dihydropteroate synthase [[Eubacterium] siraeum]MCM1455164.1 dihydropteroate synthase [Bacteroides sp.]
MKYSFKIRDKVFEGGTHVMAILNATPDSFYSGSRLSGDAAKRAGRFIAQGAEILDIGGQSTRPDAQKIGALEEMSRVLPAIEEIRAAYPDIPISVDTFFPEVAEAAIGVGADMINDVSCLAYEGMAEVIANSGAAVCAMHARRGSKIDDLFFDKTVGLQKAVDRLLKSGVCKDKIMLDGGIGFNRNSDEDWQLLRGYEKLIKEFPDYPFLLGTSRKSMFGGEVADRLPATLDSTALAVKAGVLFVRVHDVAENKAMIDAFLR